MAVKHRPCLLTPRKGFRISKPGARGNFSVSPTWSTRPTTGCGTRSTSLWVHRNFFWQLSREESVHGSSMSHATTASAEPSFWTPWRVDDAAVCKGSAGRTILKSGHSCLCQNCSQGPPAEKTRRGFLLNRPSYPPDDPIGPGTELK